MKLKFCLGCHGDISLTHGNKKRCDRCGNERNIITRNKPSNKLVVAYMRKHAPKAYRNMVEAIRNQMAETKHGQTQLDTARAQS